MEPMWSTWMTGILTAGTRGDRAYAEWRQEVRRRVVREVGRDRGHGGRDPAGVLPACGCCCDRAAA